MIDLKNTYIENDFGELLDLYVKECNKQGIEWFEGFHGLDNDDQVIFVDSGNELYSCLKNLTGYYDCLKQITLADIKPRTRVEYVKVEDSIFHLKPDFEAGELYSKHNKKDKYYMINTEIWLVSAMHNGNVFRKVEREIEWYEDIPNGGVLCVNPNEGVSVVTSYSNGVSNPFECENGDTWTGVTPLTRKEIQSLLDNAPQ